MSALARSAVLLAAAALFPPAPALASEGAGDTHPNGVEDWSVGRLPPPGLYAMVYTNYYGAGRFKDQPVRFRVDAESVTPRLLWVAPVKVLGATWAAQALLPFVNTRVRLDGVRSERFGHADLTVSPFLLDWAATRRLDVIVGLDVVVPVGDYRATRAANPGKNRWVLRPALAATWRPGRWELSGELGYDVNFRNGATGERSGNVAHVDFVAGYHPSPRLSLGLGGYFLQQVTDDRAPGGVIPHGGFRGRVAALGPTVKIDFPRVSLVGKVHREFLARNRPEGTSAWATLIVPFRRPGA